MATKKVEQTVTNDRFHDRGFSLYSKAVIDLDFSDPENYSPIDLVVELENDEHLDLLRAIVKRNDLGSEESCKADGSVMLKLFSENITFVLRSN